MPGAFASACARTRTARLTITATTLIADISRRAATVCPTCGAPLCGHQLLISIAAGFKRTPRCARCLARALERDPQEFRQHVVTYIRHRDCYRGAWEWTSAREDACPDADGTAFADVEETPPEPASSGGAADAEWDAGDMACGDLVWELRARLRRMAPGAVLRVIARDPGAPEDLPAWCRMTGHHLRAARHPDYLIERRRP